MNVVSIIVTILAVIVLLLLLIVFMLGSRLGFWHSPIADVLKQRIAISVLVVIWMAVLIWILCFI